MKACWSLCTLKRWKFWYGSRTIFKLFALELCTNPLHVRNPSIISGFLIRSWLGRYVNIVVKNLYGSNPFVFATSIMLYEFALDSAPNTLAENNQFFLPVLNGQITLPSNEFVVGTYSKFYKVLYIKYIKLNWKDLCTLNAPFG